MNVLNHYLHTNTCSENVRSNLSIINKEPLLVMCMKQCVNMRANHIFHLGD